MSDGPNGFRIRVLNGPLKDCVYPSDDRLEIGRSDTADIQLAGRGVSRQHASIVASNQGCVLLDMLSTNGTWIDGVRVTKRPLIHGDHFVIDDCEFEFEMLHPSDPPADEPDRPRISRARLSRQTVEFQGPRIKQAVSKSHNGGTPLKAPLPNFVGADACNYPGNLLADIMLYRNLRLRVVQRGDKVKPENLLRFNELDQSLRVGASHRASERREFARYSCKVPGTVRLEEHSEQRFDVVMLDVAVDGARLEAPGVPLNPRGLLWLSLPNVGVDGLRCMVFTARAAWSKRGELGLVFSGAPSWATRNRDRQDDTTPTPLAPLKLKKRSV